MRRGRHRRFRALAAACALLAARPAAGQADRWGGQVVVNGEAERYLRTLQTAGAAPLYPWSVRGFSPLEAARLVAGVDSAHPWRVHMDSAPAKPLRIIAPELRFVYNSTFPHGGNDGVVWAGRGLTSSVRGGVAARLGPLSLAVAPVLFRAENAAFPLAPNGLTGDSIFASAAFPRSIDLPQRFGSGPYARFDLGETTLRLDVAGLAAGISTAAQHWGPAWDYPLILGDNAGGFPHVFVGTGRPLSLGIASVHGRTVVGELAESDHAVGRAVSARRMMAGLAITVVPSGIDGLEIGVARFFHEVFPADGIGPGELLIPFQGLLSRSRINSSENQLISGFMRWVLPQSGLEVYGEFAREDFNWDMRDLLLQPDQNSAYMLGLRRVWGGAEPVFWATHLEMVNAGRTHIDRARLQGPFYRHAAHTQGHTHRGQILGAPAAFGGTGARLSVDRYAPDGRISMVLFREHRLPQVPTRSARRNVVFGSDVEWLRMGSRLDLTLGLAAAYEVYRGFGEHAFNLNGRIGMRLVVP